MIIPLGKGQHFFVEDSLDRTMNENLKKLVELQENLIILHESEILHGSDGERQEEVNRLQERIQELRASIPADLLARFDRLHKVGVAVIHCRNGVCSGCFMKIPDGELLRLKKQKEIPQCPHCGAFMIIEEES